MDVAIIGSGIAGLAAAFKLTGRCNVTIYEQNDYAGGHSNTAVIAGSQSTVAVDTGFMVFNKVTYPNLTRLFEQLQVPIKKTDMSFSVQIRANDFEFAGASWSRLFGDKRNLFNVGFWKMLVQLNRFNKEAIDALSDDAYNNMTVQNYVDARNYGNDFLHYYLLPMSSAVWSTPPATMLTFPVKTLLRFFHNHGFLGMNEQHQWWTVEGGSRVYVNLLLAAIDPRLHLQVPVTKVTPAADNAVVVTRESERIYDKVILATHADQALKLLQPSDTLQTELLSCFSYQRNSALLHTDAAVMPKARACWSSWNYRLDQLAKGYENASTHYWMNSLQNVCQNQNYFVSLNAEDLVDPRLVLRRYQYDHPIFSLSAAKAQERLHALNNRSSDQSIYFCGSYFRYGFHEDALVSGYAAAEALLKSKVTA